MREDDKLVYCTAIFVRSTSPAAEVMLARVDCDRPIKQGGATATKQLLLEVIRKLSTRDEGRRLCVGRLVRWKVLFQPLA
jgi:hypothetical protein